jgi:hypothetical protein
MSPVVAVIGTWILMTGWTMLLGSWAGVLAARSAGLFGGLRAALWAGLAVLIATVLIANLFMPLMGTPAILTALAVTIVAGVAGAVAWLRARRLRPPESSARERRWWVLVPILAMALMLVLFAHWYAGPPTNYDSGIYHLNAIQFSADFRTIIGLANMQDRLGTNISSFNLAAFMGNSAWGIEAFRLLVGFFAFIFATDTALRLLDRRPASLRSPGLYIMLIATLLAWPFLLTSPNLWLTSPTPDTIALFLTIVAGAYLADAFALGEERSVWAALALVTAALTATVRTQLWVLVFLTAAVLWARWKLDRRGGREPRGRTNPLTWASAVGASVLFVVMMIRDALLSGWLLFPAPLLPLPVDWRVPDTTGTRQWMLSWAREPTGDPARVLADWAWFRPWLGRSLDDWAVRGAIGSLVLFAVLVLVSRKIDGSGHSAGDGRCLGLTSRLAWLLVMVPAAGTVFVWFWAAPDPRFAWGAIALLGLIPTSLALFSMADRSRGEWSADLVPAIVAGFMCAAIVPPAVAGIVQIKGFIEEGYEVRTVSFGPFDVTGAVIPVTTPDVYEFRLESGRTVVVPRDSDQCWMSFPLCRPYPDPTLQFMGPDLFDGLSSSRLK